MAKTPGKRALQSEHKRELILEKSLALFRQYGYEKTTVGDICDECNINVGTLYHFFGNKWGILEEICTKMSRSGVLLENMEEYACDPYPAFMKFHIDYAERWEKLGVDLTEHFYRNFKKIYYHPTTNIYQASDTIHELGVFIKAAQDAGTFDTTVDAMETAHLMIIAGRGLVHDWCLHSGAYDLTKRSIEIMGRITKLLIAGVPAE